MFFVRIQHQLDTNEMYTRNTSTDIKLLSEVAPALKHSERTSQRETFRILKNTFYDYQGNKIREETRNQNVKLNICSGR